MKTIEHLVARVEKTAEQKRDLIKKLEHLERRFETHNDRVEAKAEVFLVVFELSPNKKHIIASIVDSYDNIVAEQFLISES